MSEAVEHDNDGPLEALARSIAAQTDALGHLRFKFEVQQMMLTGGGSTWVSETMRTPARTRAISSPWSQGLVR